VTGEDAGLLAEAERIALAAWGAPSERKMDRLRRDKITVQDIAHFIANIMDTHEVSPAVGDLFAAAARAWVELSRQVEAEEGKPDHDP
jgi:hypothetical protein